MVDNSGNKYLNELPSDKKKEVLIKLERIEKSVLSDDMPDVVKVFALNKYITITSIYDSVNYYQKKAGKLESLPDNDYSLYGIICRRMGVCSGITKAMCLLLERQNIECKYVSGKTHNSTGTHAWNLVKLDGCWYALDVTWNLNSYYNALARYNDLKNNFKKTEGQKKSEGESLKQSMLASQYKYFLLNDEEMKETREWDYSKYPKCETGPYSNGKYKLVLEHYERVGKKKVLGKIIWAL